LWRTKKGKVRVGRPIATGRGVAGRKTRVARTGSSAGHEKEKCKCGGGGGLCAGGRKGIGAHESPDTHRKTKKKQGTVTGDLF